VSGGLWRCGGVGAGVGSCEGMVVLDVVRGVNLDE